MGWRNKKYFTIFTGEGGYDFEKEEAKKHFVVGQEYRVIGGTIHSSSTSVRIEGIPGHWNSCLFDMDIFNAPLQHDYPDYQR